jgi:hypothetical protein
MLAWPHTLRSTDFPLFLLCGVRFPALEDHHNGASAGVFLSAVLGIFHRTYGKVSFESWLSMFKTEPGFPSVQPVRFSLRHSTGCLRVIRAHPDSQKRSQDGLWRPCGRARHSPNGCF